MNIILLEAPDLKEDIATLSDRRFQHIKNIHQAKQHQILRIGQVDGKIGEGEIISIDDRQVVMKTDFKKEPPPCLNLTLIIALPRPKMLKRILQSIASLGVKDIYLINSYKVDKSYWSTPILKDESIKELLLLGLEQSVDTILPKVHLRKRFKPFVEDELEAISSGSKRLLAHPYQSADCPKASTDKTTLLIGPEGGFTDYEVNKLQELNFSSISLGSRILKVETAIPVAISKLCQL